MKGKEALSAARQRIAVLEAELAQRDVLHAQQVARLRSEGTQREQVAQRHLSEITASLRRDVEAASSDHVRQLEAEVRAVRSNLVEVEQKHVELQEIYDSVWRAFSAELRRQGMTGLEAFERVAHLSGLASKLPRVAKAVEDAIENERPVAPITVRTKKTRVAKDAVAARRIEVARGQRNAEWVELTPDGIEGSSFSEKVVDNDEPLLMSKGERGR